MKQLITLLLALFIFTGCHENKPKQVSKVYNFENHSRIDDPPMAKPVDTVMLLLDLYSKLNTCKDNMNTYEVQVYKLQAQGLPYEKYERLFYREQDKYNTYVGELKKIQKQINKH